VPVSLLRAAAPLVWLAERYPARRRFSRRGARRALRDRALLPRTDGTGDDLSTFSVIPLTDCVIEETLASAQDCAGTIAGHRAALREARIGAARREPGLLSSAWKEQICL
jgi:hypothetical protein